MGCLSRWLQSSHLKEVKVDFILQNTSHLIKELWERSSCSLSQLGLHSMKTSFLSLRPCCPFICSTFSCCAQGCVLWLKSLDPGTHNIKSKSSSHHILRSCLSQWVILTVPTSLPTPSLSCKSSIYFLVLFLEVNEAVQQHGVPCRAHTFKRLKAGGQRVSAREVTWQPKLEPWDPCGRRESNPEIVPWPPHISRDMHLPIYIHRNVSSLSVF